jgi:hypothetical protein
MREIWLIFSSLLSVFWIFWAVEGLSKEKNNIEARAEVKRLSKITLRLFSRGKPPSGEEFWKFVGMEKPLADPWGSALVLNTLDAESFEWRSAGADRILHTVDDVAVKVPYGDGLNPDLTEPNPAETGLPSTDVR